jgi:hypothetical protein
MTTENKAPPTARPPPRRCTGPSTPGAHCGFATGALLLLAGIIGIFVPLLPTTPFVLLAAFCFARQRNAGSAGWSPPALRSMVRNWRDHRAVPLRAKQLATVMMTLGSVWAAWMLPVHLCWIPAACCTVVAAWLWSLPSR